MLSKYVDIHTHNIRSLDHHNCIQLVNHEWNKSKPKTDYLCASIHPWNLPENLSINENFLKSAFQDNQYIALGEIGLDKVSQTPWSLQLEHYICALKFAEQAAISPIILHSVKAHQEVIKEIVKYNHQSHFIFHDYHGSVRQTEEILKFDRFYISLGSVLNRPQSKIFNYLKDLPLEKIFFETDDSGQSIEEKYQEFCDITGHSIHDVIRVCYNNFTSLFPGINCE